MSHDLIRQICDDFLEDGKLYLEKVKNQEYYLSIDSPKSQNFCSVCDKMAKSFRFFPFHRIRLVKKMVKGLVDSGYISPCKITFSLFGENAYMRDSGELHFSLKWLYGEGSGNFVKTVLHEISHLRLLCFENYGLLKEKDRLFHALFGNDKDIYVLSPIEVVALMWSVELINICLNGCSNEKIATRYQEQVVKEREKLSNAIEIFYKKFVLQ